MPNIIETRLIYTAGTYKFSDAMRNCRRILILVDLLRKPPFQIYANEKSNPPVYFLGYWTLWIGDYVYDKRPLEFTEQCIIHYANPELQMLNNLLAVGTQLSTIMQRLGAAMSPPAPITLFPSANPEFEGCPYTWIKFKMPEGTRIQLTAVGTPLQVFAGAQATPSASDPTDSVPAYPDTPGRSSDPPRSLPNPGEKPGDTAPVTSSDPEAASSGSWLLTFTTQSGPNTSFSYPGVSTDTWAILRPGTTCTLSGSSRLVKNGTTVVSPNFNCNSSNFVSAIVSAVFTRS